MEPTSIIDSPPIPTVPATRPPSDLDGVQRFVRPFDAGCFAPGGSAFGLWLPAILITAVVLLSPVYLAIRSLGAGEKFWQQLLRWTTVEILFNTGLLVAVVTAVAVLIAAPLAWLTTRTNLPARKFWVVILSLPLVIPSYVGALVVIATLGPRGLLQQGFAQRFGIERLPEIYGFPGAVLTLSLLTYPLVLLTLRAGWQSLDPAQEEAASSLGLGPWRTFFRVTLPQLMPAIGSGGLLVALYTLSDFGAVSLLRYRSFTQAIYIQYQSSFDRSLAAGWSLLLVGLALVIVMGEQWCRGQRRYHRAGSGSRRPARIVCLAAWRWPATMMCGLLALVALVAPLGVLLFWLIRGAFAGELLVIEWRLIGNTLGASGLAAITGLIAALPIAILAVRYPSWQSRLIERISYLGYALPGIAVALAMVFFSIRYAGPLYQTLPLLILAYVVLFLPQAVGAIRTSLLQVKPSVEEAARSLGAGAWRVTWRVTLPLVQAGLLAGFGLVFLTTMKELPATLILGPTGFQTLATRVWSTTIEGYLARAALPALLLIVLAAAPLAVLLWSQREEQA